MDGKSITHTGERTKTNEHWCDCLHFAKLHELCGRKRVDSNRSHKMSRLSMLYDIKNSIPLHPPARRLYDLLGVDRMNAKFIVICIEMYSLSCFILSHSFRLIVCTLVVFFVFFRRFTHFQV